MSKITIINDAEQAALVTNGTVTAGKIYLKGDGSTNAGDVVIYNGSEWKRFANEYATAGFNISTQDTEANILTSSPTNPSGEVTLAYATDTGRLCVYDGTNWVTYDNNFTI